MSIHIHKSHFVWLMESVETQVKKHHLAETFLNIVVLSVQRT